MSEKFPGFNAEVINRERIEREQFEEQFQNFETFQFKGTQFEALDLKPAALRNETPILLIPGFGKTPRSYKEALFEIFKSGRRVISLTAPTGEASLSPEEKGDIPQAQAERAYSMLHLLSEKEYSMSTW